MIWEKDVSTIVMLARLVEDAKVCTPTVHTILKKYCHIMTWVSKFNSAMIL